MGKEPFVHWVIAHRSLSFISSHSREWRVGEPKIALAAIAGQWPFFATVASRSTARLNMCGARSAWATMGHFFRFGSCCALLLSESRFRSLQLAPIDLSLLYDMQKWYTDIVQYVRSHGVSISVASSAFYPPKIHSLRVHFRLKNISRCAGLKVKKAYEKKAYTLRKSCKKKAFTFSM